MKHALLILLLLALLVQPASPSITDGADPVVAVTITDLPGTAGIEVELEIIEDPDPIPQVSVVGVVSIIEGPDPIPMKHVSLEHKGTSVSVRTKLDDRALEGVLVIFLSFGGSEPVAFVIDLGSITDDADPV